VLSRFVLAFILTLPITWSHIVEILHEGAVNTLSIRMASSVGGTLQVFFDIGAGFNEIDSRAAPIGPGMQEYRLPLPAGRYQKLRIDPGIAAGVYDIQHVAVLTPAGTTRTLIPLTNLIAANHLTILQHNDKRLLVRCPEPASDPQLVYSPPEPFILWPPRTFGLRLALLILICATAVTAIVILERALAPVGPSIVLWLRELAHRALLRPGFAIFVSAAIGTLVATYPVVFLDRSFVSPNDGGVGMLYDQPPFVPGSADFTVEDTRKSDVGAMMWAFVPYAKVQREAIAGGEVPLWNRYNATGRPLWGQGQTFLLDPLHWFTLVTPDPALGWDLKFVAHRLVFAWGIGTAAVLATGAPVPAIMVGAIAPFAGHFTFRFNHPAAFSLTYAPWILVAWFLLAGPLQPAQEARAALFLAGASSLELVASPPKEAVSLLLGCHLAGALAVLIGVNSLGIRCRRLALAGVAGVGMVLVTSPHWFVFFDTLRMSSTAYDVPGANVAGVPHALSFVLGNLSPGSLHTGLHVLGVTLACVALASPLRLARHRSAMACALAAAVLIAIAFGSIPRTVLMRIPLLSNIHQIDVTLMMAALVLVLVVAASGTDALCCGPRERIVALSGLLLGGGLVVFGTFGGPSALERFEPWAAVVALGFAALLPALVANAREAPNRLMPMLAVAAVCGVLAVPGGLHVETGVPALDRVLLQPRFRVHLDQNSPTVDAIHRLAMEPTRVAGLGHVLFSGSQVLYEIEGIGGPDALQLEVYEQLMNAAGVHREWGWLRTLSIPELPRLGPFLDLLNVGFLLVRSEEAQMVSEVAALEGQDLLRAVRRPTAWPRAFFVDGLFQYKDAADFIMLLAQRQGPFAAVLIEDTRAHAVARRLRPPSGRSIPAEAYELTVNTSRFRVRTPGPGVAVLTEAFMPQDFLAMLNGAPTPYFRVNHAFKGVFIPAAGDWEVDFEYRPARWRVSLGLAGLGLVMLTGLGLAGWRFRNPVGARPQHPPERASS
jgi:hypothetical protein